MLAFYMQAKLSLLREVVKKSFLIKNINKKEQTLKIIFNLIMLVNQIIHVPKVMNQLYKLLSKKILSSINTTDRKIR